jgi:predicted RNase H-like HicB family nuclease
MEIQFTTRIFKEGRTFVAYTRELDLSSCGGTRQKALRNIKEAVRLFLEEAEKMGTPDVNVRTTLAAETQDSFRRLAMLN